MIDHTASATPSLVVRSIRGKVASWDAVFYRGGQFLGAVAAASRWQGSHCRAHPRTKRFAHAVTLPGVYGDASGFLAELFISFLLMIAILAASNHKVLALIRGTLPLS
jgi:glycerol uptake facilitator-like aquaporin